MASNEEEVRWTTKEIIVVLASTCLKMTEGAEIYLPGVITQSVACSLELSRFSEVLLGASLYIAVACSTLIAGYLANKWSVRRVLILSIYMSVSSIVISVSLPDAYTLILSRAVIGLSIGFSYANASTFLGNNVPIQSHRIVGIVIALVAFTVASAWISLFGYLILDIVGWRYFVGIASLPLYVLPLILFHFFLPETSDPENGEGQESELESLPSFNERLGNGGIVKKIILDFFSTFIARGTSDPENGKEQKSVRASRPPLSKSLRNGRVIQKIILDFFSTFVGFGGVLLLPVLIRFIKKKQNATVINLTNECFVNAVQGEELIYLTLAGVGRILGRCLAYPLRWIISFRYNVMLQGFLLIVCYVTILVFDSDIAVVVPCMSIASLFYGIVIMEVAYMLVAVDYFGPEHLGNCNTLGLTASAAGGALAVAITLVVDSPQTVYAYLLASFSLLCTGWFVKDFKR